MTASVISITPFSRRRCYCSLSPATIYRLLLLPLLLLVVGSAEANAAAAREDRFVFTNPYYEGWAQEFGANKFSRVTSNVMMGMWDSDVTEQVNFSVVPENKYFHVQRETIANFHFLRIDVRVNEKAELMNNQTLSIRARSADSLHETYCRVHVHVHDTNNLSPHFKPFRSPAEIPENSPVGTVITTMKAYDRDYEFRHRYFYYALAHDTNNFAIHPTSGRVVLSAPVSHAWQPVHSVDIYAIDRGNGRNTSVTLLVSVTAVNKHAPEIMLKKLTYSDSSSNQTLTVLECSDPDEKMNGRLEQPHITNPEALEFVALLPGSTEGNFLINLKKHPLTERRLNVTVRVSDLGSPKRVTWKSFFLTLPIENAYIPIFNSSEPLRFAISEWCQPGTHVGYVSAWIPYGSAVEYAITDGDMGGVFSIDAKSGLLRLDASVDREEVDRYQLQIVAYNADAVGKVEYRKIIDVEVDIEDVNDNDPQFIDLPYSITASEAETYNGTIFTVSATDPDAGQNGTVTYQLIDTDGIPLVIDHLTGEISVTGPLDSDRRSTRKFFVRVRAQDSGFPYARMSDTAVVVTINDVNDNAPQFSYTSCQVTYPMNLFAEGRDLLVLNPLDLDSVPNTGMTCRLKPEQNYFYIPAGTCKLKMLNLRRDRAIRYPSFNFNIVASDSQLDSKPVPVEVRFTEEYAARVSKNCKDSQLDAEVQRINSNPSLNSNFDSISMNTSSIRNNHAPEVYRTGRLQNVHVLEDAPVGHRLVHVSARDIDNQYNGLLWFTLTDGDVDSCFRVDHLSGDLYLSRPLDRERTSSYQLKVHVTDLGEVATRKSSVAAVNVIVDDANDNAPVFEQDVYEFEMLENATETHAMLVHATDEDEGDNALVEYSINSVDMRLIGHKFLVDQTSGRISLNGSLDREMKSMYSFRITARDQAPAGKQKEASVMVTVRVMDVNDNKPTFSREEYSVNVAEDMPRFTVIYWLTARDADEGENGKIWYTLVSGNIDQGQELFIIDKKSGAVRLMQKLNAAYKSTYHLHIRARDRTGQNTKCLLMINILPVNHNEFRPEFDFTEKQMTVPENTPVGQIIGFIDAYDDDVEGRNRDVVYDIIDGTGIGLFALDRYTGNISVSQSLDREEDMYYWLTVSARDGGLIPLENYMHVVITVLDVNDNVPMARLPVYHTSLREDSASNQFVVQIEADDKDQGANGKFSFSLEGTDAFRIDEHSGDVYATRKLERNNPVDLASLSFMVQMTDEGKPPLSSRVPVNVHLAAARNSKPVFLAALTSPSPVLWPRKQGAAIVRVLAESGDGSSIRYHLIGDSWNQFTIDEDSGVISTSSKTSSKANTQTTVQVEAIAGNGNNRATESFAIAWAKKPTPGKSSRVGFDFQRLEVSYPEHVAREYGYTQAATSRLVTQLRTSEETSGQKLLFEIVDGNVGDMFYVHPSDGHLYVVGEPDAEARTAYDLTVQVSNGKKSKSAHVEVNITDVNDYPPTFETRFYHISVSEDTPADSEIVRLRADDGDVTVSNRNLVYRLTGTRDQNSAHKFSISIDGVIRTTSKLDRERQMVHELMVEVSDQGQPLALKDHCHVIIKLTDVNEHAPKFSMDEYRTRFVVAPESSDFAMDDHTGIYELGGRSGLDQVLATVTAVDRDYGRNGKVTYQIVEGNDNNVWRIDPDTGDLSAAKLPPLQPDSARGRVQVLKVQARDGAAEPLESYANVSIEIVASRDVAPRFVADEFRADVVENATIGSVVAKVTAHGSSGVSYLLESGGDGHFRLDSTTGVVTLLLPLNYEFRREYRLTMKAHSTEVPLATSASLVINVLDVNDNRPVLEQVVYESRIGAVSDAENAVSPLLDSVGAPLVVRAHDLDSGNGGLLRFRIVEQSGDLDDIERRFAVDERTGAILSFGGANLFDYAAKQKYDFQVEVTDRGSPSLVAVQHARVTVLVDDERATTLRFSRRKYKVRLRPPLCEGFVIPADVRVVRLPVDDDVAALNYSFTTPTTMFEVDHTSGVITVRDEDLPDGKVISLGLHVSDGVRSADAVIEMTMGEKVDSFSRSFVVSTPENSTEELVIVSLSGLVTDIDKQVTYSILNPDPAFTIQGATITTTGIPLDREEKSLYTLLIEAEIEETYETAQYRRTNVTVKVDDVNDNSPEILELPLTANVRKDSRVGSPVKRVRAMDRDAGESAEVSFSLHGSHAHFFTIDQQTGLISTRLSLAAVNNDKLHVLVKAVDSGTPPLDAEEQISIRIIDGESPIFQQSSIRGINVREDALPGALVTDMVKASNTDQTEINYAIVRGDDNKKFDIDFSTGTLFTRAKLDREQTDSYQLTVRAFNPTASSHAEATVEVKIVDVNDNAPRFQLSQYRAQIVESSKIGTHVIQVQARDADMGANADITYTIATDGTHSLDKLQVDPVTGMLYTVAELDRELTSSIRVVVRATDAGAPSLYTDVEVMIGVIDINDNPPIFKREMLDFKISTLAEGGDLIGEAGAYDEDISDQDRLTYLLETDDPININDQTGFLSLNENFVSSRNQSAFAGKVIATDGVFSTDAPFVVRFVDERRRNFHFRNCPLGGGVTMEMDENAMVNTAVGKMNTTGSDNDVTYAIETSTAEASKLRIDPISGVLFTQEPIERGMLGRGDDVIRLTVTGRDSSGTLSRCDVTVEVNDVNDGVPRFDRDLYEADLVIGKTHVGDYITKVRAFDNDLGVNSQIVYSWDNQGDSAEPYFVLNPQTGEIGVKKLPTATGDRRLFSFYVKAVDGGGLSSVVGVTINLASSNDPIPHFNRPMWRMSVYENITIGSEITTVSATADNREVHYKIVTLPAKTSESAQQRTLPFSIKKSSGQIVTTGNLDHEEHTSYELTIVAYVRTTPELVAETKVVIDVLDINDNRPQFDTSEYRAWIEENSQPRDLLRVHCSDPDSGIFGRIKYRFNDTYSKYRIDEDTGEVFVTEALDREADYNPTLEVICTDGGDLSSNSQIIVEVVDVNDFNLAFEKDEYNFEIAEGSPAGVRTASEIRAIDRDSSTREELLNAAIIAGDGENRFGVYFESVQSLGDSGVDISLGLKLLKAFDSKAAGHYTLVISLTDGVHRKNVTAHVSQIKTSTGPVWSAHEPVCSKLLHDATISEDSDAGTSVVNMNLRTNGNDDWLSSLTYELTGEGHEDFDVSPSTATLITKNSLDRETKDLYRLKLTVTYPEGESCSIQIFVRITDVNDNPPKIAQKPIKLSVREDAKVGSVLYRVVATDSDEGENSTLNYSIFPRENHFEIGNNNGLLTLRKSLDRESIPSYKLTVAVTDNGSAIRKSSTAQLLIHVTDVNDNAPVFYQTNFNATIAEDTKRGHLVAVVSAYSLDDGANAKLRYAITGGNERKKFAIDENTGEVRLVEQVDYETDKGYVLKVRAEDRSENPLKKETSLHITVLDVNDNAPTFAGLQSPIYVLENVVPGTFVAQIQAFDNDNGVAGHVTYSIVNRGHRNLPFVIDPDSGRLEVTDPGLDHETKSMYVLQVIGTDGGQPRLTGRAEVVVHVKDVNDNRPEVTIGKGAESVAVSCVADEMKCSALLHENAEGLDVDGIVVVSARDLDDGAGNADPFVFQLITDENDQFRLDEKNRLISNKKLQVDALSANPNAQTHTFTIIATDAGSLSSKSMQLEVIVLKESLYDPIVSPQNISIITAQDQFDGGTISQGLHATDKDPYDEKRLRFRIDSPDDFDFFTINPLNGSVVVTAPLRAGSEHNVTVRVSDGSRDSVGNVIIKVNQITQQSLRSSVEINFSGVASPQYYIEKMHPGLALTLKETLPQGFDPDRDIEIISLKGGEDSQLKLLFSIRKPMSSEKSSFFPSNPLRTLLVQSKTILSERLCVQVDAIIGTDCGSARIPCSGRCEDTITLTNITSQIPVTSNHWSILSPTFTRQQTCICPKGFVGSSCRSVCDVSDDVCPAGEVCHLDETESSGYRCAKPNVPPEVSAYGGYSCQRYLTDTALPFQVAFRLRTYQQNSTLLRATNSASGSSAHLQIVGGLLQFTFDCGHGSQRMHQSEPRLVDGNWHDVTIEPLTGDCAYRVILDRKFEATSASGVVDDRRLMFTQLNVGGLMEDGSRDVRDGFIGCLEDFSIGGELVKKSPETVSLMDETQVLTHCPVQIDRCAENYCANGGRCAMKMTKANTGSPYCVCMTGYAGSKCEVKHACGTLPCKNQGVCHSQGEDDFRCQCKDGYHGQFCEKPCDTGYKGHNCEEDIDECLTDEAVHACGSTLTCFNYQGGFACNCSSVGFDVMDPGCGNVLTPLPSQTNSLVAIIVGIVGILLIVVIIIAFVCYRRRNRERRRGSVNQGEKFYMQPIEPRGQQSRNPSIPPIPQRPADYQRCSRGSLSENQETRSPLLPNGGDHHPNQPPINSTSSESSSLHKPPASWADYDRNQQVSSESGSSSLTKMQAIHQAPSHQSINDQHYAWDVSDWANNGTNEGGDDTPTNDIRIPDHVTSVPAHRHRANTPSTTSSRTPSVTGNYPASPGPNHRTNDQQRNSNLPGVYQPRNKRRSRKTSDSKIRMHRPNDLETAYNRAPLVVTDPPNNQVQMGSYDRQDPNYQQRHRYHHQPVAAPGGGGGGKNRGDRQVLTSDSSNTTEKNFADSERDESDDIVPLGYEELARLRQQVPQYGYNYPPPPAPTRRTPADQQQDLDDIDDVNYTMSEASHARSYSSLLSGQVDTSMPTPSMARKNKFHPDMYLPSVQMDGFGTADSRPGSATSMDVASSQSGTFRYKSPSSPRNISESFSDRTFDVTNQLVMSSLSDLDEEMTDALLAKKKRSRSGGNNHRHDVTELDTNV